MTVTGPAAWIVMGPPAGFTVRKPLLLASLPNISRARLWPRITERVGGVGDQLQEGKIQQLVALRSEDRQREVGRI